MVCRSPVGGDGACMYVCMYGVLVSVVGCLAAAAHGWLVIAFARALCRSWRLHASVAFSL